MNWPADDEPVFREETLQQVTTDLPRSPEIPESLPNSPVVGLRKSRRHSSDPGREVLVANLCPTNPGLLQIVTSPSEHSSVDLGFMETNAGEKVDGEVKAPAASSDSLQVRSVERHDSAQEEIAELDPKALAASASAAIATNEVSGDTHAKKTNATTVHAAEDAVPQRSPEQRPSHSAARSPLKLHTASSNPGMKPPPPVPGNTITVSPTLAKNAVQIAHAAANTLPAVQPLSPPIQDREPRSPLTGRLPSFRTFTGQLNELAEAAAIQEPRAYSHHHSLSFGSATSQSPRLAYHTSGFPGSAQTSPVSHYAYSARSPTSTISEVPHHIYGSPQQHATPTAYFTDTRSSASTEIASRFPAPLPSASTSSGESHGHAGSSADGYSTSHTTPVDPLPTADGTPRPILPPPPGMMTGFLCDEAGCTAAPFQTQYLLSSHRNVHSSTRPHFCPVEGCPRSDGGKGFKRKNEMIRHGLVHNSPGYICPFCPDREHRYPRPDNLQRHVRVHHVDKDKDDAALREVLAQRIEGAGKQRRRRTDVKGTVA